MEICSVGVALILADRRMDVIKVIAAFQDNADVPKDEVLLCLLQCWI